MNTRSRAYAYCVNITHVDLHPKTDQLTIYKDTVDSLYLLYTHFSGFQVNHELKSSTNDKFSTYLNADPAKPRH